MKRSNLTTAYVTGIKGIVSAMVAILFAEYSHRRTADVMQAINDGYSQSLRAAMGRDNREAVIMYGPAIDRGTTRLPNGLINLELCIQIYPEYRTLEEDIAVKEHELMIANHEYTCSICIENAKPLRQKALEAMLKKWHS